MQSPDQDRSPGIGKMQVLRSSFRELTRALEVFDQYGNRIGFLVVSSRPKAITFGTFTEYEATHT